MNVLNFISHIFLLIFVMWIVFIAVIGVVILLFIIIPDVYKYILSDVKNHVNKIKLRWRK